MAAQIGLGQLYQALEQSDQAEQHFRQAELAAVYLCDNTTLEALKTVFTELSKDSTEQEDIGPGTETMPIPCAIDPLDE